MGVRLMRRPMLIVAILLAVVGNAHPQKASTLTPVRDEAKQRAVSYTFVSPNTRENLTLEEAIKLLNSPEEIQLINDIRRLSRCLRLKPMVSRAIGSWTDGAEHSTLFRVYTDQPTLRYEDARLGKSERQKSVLSFRLNDSGKGKMYILYTQRSKPSVASISRTLDKNGVAFRTLVPRPHRQTIIYVVDLSGALQKQVVAASRQLGARLVMVKGVGEFIGDDTDRDKAQQVFADEIKKYEDEHPKVARGCSH